MTSVFKRIVAVFAVAMLLSTAVAVSVPEPAFAGANGQIVRFRCDAGIQEVWYNGTNQNGVASSWHSTPGGVNQVTPSGYYWKGTLHINYKIVGNNTIFYNQYSIPTTWWGPQTSTR